MNFRIKKYPEGFVVEVEKQKWYGKKYWTTFITYTGMIDKPFHFRTYESAEGEMLLKIKWDTIKNSDHTERCDHYFPIIQKSKSVETLPCEFCGKEKGEV